MKNKINQSIIFLITVILLIGCNYKHPKSPHSVKYTALQDSIQEWINQDQLIGAELLILENEQLILHNAFGWSDKEAEEKLNKGSIWTVMSMTKPFTATAILMLAEDGTISLDDPITKYIQNFSGNSEVTIRHLLAQSSGDDGNYGDGGHNVLEYSSLNDWIGEWAKQESKGSFGEFAYSNFNYGALAYIVEQVTGVPVEFFIQKRIIEPLDLKNTYVIFSPDSSWADFVPNRYQWNEKKNEYEQTWTHNEPQSWKFFTGALGLWMSAEDYATFIQVWINNGRYKDTHLLKESTVKEALTIHANAYRDEFFGHGYGWFIDEQPKVFRYGGSAGGVGIGYPKKNTVVIYLTHSAGSDHKGKFQDALDRVWFPDENKSNSL